MTHSFPTRRSSDLFQMQVVEIEPESLGPLGKQHGLAMFEPELPQVGILLFGKIREHILVVDDAVLEDFDEAGALMCMGSLQHVEIGRASCRERVCQYV